MIWKKVTLMLLLGLFMISAALLTANAQYIDTNSGGQIYANQPYNAAQPSNFVPPTGMASAANTVPNANFAQQPYSYAAPYLGASVPAAAPYAAPYGTMMPAAGPYTGPVAAPCAAPLAAPLAAPCTTPLAAPVVPCGPFTSGFTYSAQQASAFGPFTPPVSQAAEQFYQFPGLTPYGPYPGAGYATAGGVGFDPLTGYYGPYGGVTPLV